MKLTKRYRNLFPVLIITLFGFLLRTYNIEKNPWGFFCDEAATGYNAYTILKSGTDEFGKPFPIFFYSFGNNRLPLPIYLTVPFIATFGLNEFSTRLASAFFGALTIPLVFFLLSTLFPKRKSVGPMGAFFLAIAPWHIHFSRTAHEYIYLPFFIILGLTLIISAIKKKNPLFLYLGFINLSFAFYTYYPSYLIVPFILILVITIYLKDLLRFKKHFLFALFSFFLVTAPLAAGFLDGRALTRWEEGEVSIFSKYKTPKDVIRKFVYSYSLQFSPNFLFIKGDIDFPGQFITRHSVRGMGMLYWIELPLVVVSIIYILLKRGKAELLILGLLIIYPLGNAVTSTINPHAPRTILGSAVWPMISAVGFFTLKDIIHKKIKIIFILFFAAIISVFFPIYLYKYHREYPLYSSGYWGWQSGPREIMKVFLENKDNYDELIIVGNFNAPEIFLKFYDPKDICLGKCEVGDIESSFDSQRKQLYAVSSDKLDTISMGLTFKPKDYILYPDNHVAFFIGELSINEKQR